MFLVVTLDSRNHFNEVRGLFHCMGFTGYGNSLIEFRRGSCARLVQRGRGMCETRLGKVPKIATNIALRRGAGNGRVACRMAVWGGHRMACGVGMRVLNRWKGGGG